MPRIQTLLRSFVLLLPLASCGCRGAANGEKPAPAGSASAAAGECAAYSKSLCDKVGPDSQHCMAIRDLQDILSPKACAAGTKEFAYTERKLVNEAKPCTDLIERLCKDVGPETESCKMVRARTPGFGPRQCIAMTEQYASVLGELRKAEEKTRPLDLAKQATLVEGAHAVFGPKDAKVKVVVFSDFQCPFCAKATTTLDVVRQSFADKVYLVFRQFPLSFHEHAHLAAEASLAAAEQGKFWEFHDKVFANQGAIARENLEAYAKDVGLDVVRFKAALDEGKFKAAVDSDLDLGKSVNVEGTPTLFLNGKVVQNVADAPALVAAIDTELKQPATAQAAPAIAR
jgi:protein-disulfide isomerase